MLDWKALAVAEARKGSNETKSTVKMLPFGLHKKFMIDVKRGAQLHSPAQ